MKYYIHLQGSGAGNSSKGINFGSLSNGSPLKELEQKNYYGNLLKWAMFHSKALERDEAIELLNKIEEADVGLPVVTNFEAITHEDGLYIKDWIDYYWMRYKWASEIYDHLADKTFVIEKQENEAT